VAIREIHGKIIYNISKKVLANFTLTFSAKPAKTLFCKKQRLKKKIILFIDELKTLLYFCVVIIYKINK
jgi:hypothetical protein